MNKNTVVYNDFKRILTTNIFWGKLWLRVAISKASFKAMFGTMTLVNKI